MGWQQNECLALWRGGAGGGVAGRRSGEVAVPVFGANTPDGACTLARSFAVATECGATATVSVDSPAAVPAAGRPPPAAPARRAPGTSHKALIKGRANRESARPVGIG